MTSLSGNHSKIFLHIHVNFLFGPPAEKRDLMTNSENLIIMYILKFYQCRAIPENFNDQS